MKKLIYSTLGLIITGSLFFAGCKDKGTGNNPTPEVPKPTITFKSDPGYNSADVSVTNTLPTSALKFGFVVNHTIDLKSVSVTRNYDGSGAVIILTKNVTTKTFQMDIFDTLPAVLKGNYVYTFTAIDKDATMSTKTITISAVGALIEITDQKLYNNFGKKEGAFDLINGEALFNSDPTNSARRDIKDNGKSSSFPTAEWTTGNTTKFIKNPPTITWSQTTTDAKLKSAYEVNVSLEKQTISGIVVGDLIIAKVDRTGSPRYFMIRINEVVDQSGADNDYTAFDFKY